MSTKATKPQNGTFHRHTIAVDVALFTIQDGSLKVLLVKRKHAPFKNSWALPGGIVMDDESVDSAILRELQEETNIGNIYLEQLYTFGEPNRDPRGRVISVTYYALVNWQQFQLKTLHRTSEAVWFDITELPPLAFDHNRIVNYAVERLRNKINYTTISFQLLPKEFTLTEMQKSYEVLLSKRLDKRNFRRKMLQLGILRLTRNYKAIGRQRPARLYTFTEPKVIKLQEKGIIVPF